MIDMPSARMPLDAELSAGASFFQNTQHYYLGFQALPWLETSFRYSGLSRFDPSYPVYWDRSFAIKARLWNESSFFPAIAIGINDLVGTGIYSSEFIVASKRIGPLDFTLGMGWGRLGEADGFRNPLGNIFPSFKNRGQFSGEGGQLSGNQYFHGRTTAPFGGIIWHTPIEKLSLIAEYSSDQYMLEAERGAFRPRSQFNYGASYQVADGITLGLNWLYGRSVGGNISFQVNPLKPQYLSKLDIPALEAKIRTPEDQQLSLQTLLQSERGITVSRRQANDRHTTFVDTLWQVNGLRSAELRGRTLVLNATGDTARHCIAVAQIAQVYGEEISNVIVKNGSSNAVQCITEAATEPAYQSLAFVPSPTLFEPIQTPAIATVIDAVGPDIGKIAAAIQREARRQRITIEAVSLTNSTAIVYYNNFHYFSEADALDRLTRIMMTETPPQIEKFRFIAVVNGVAQQEFDILRGPEERQFTQTGKTDLFSNVGGTAISAAPMQNSVLAEANRTTYPRFSWNIYPQLRQELFDPAGPFAIQLAAVASGSVELRPGLSINGEAETSLFDNFNLERQSNSSLPHVRSDFLKYFARGKTGIGELDTQYRFRVNPDIFAIVKAGYLESMFAGGGGEILWRPEKQRWALGVDAYEVWQRGFDRLFDLQNYHAFTGHVSLYYASPWHDLNFTLSAGQYLAGDRGLTFQVTRRFATGVEIGAFFTKTNVSSEQFGEGSFDKGIIIRIPLGWSLPIETQGVWGVDLRPIQRDGGQRLLGDAVLYDETQRSSESEIRRGLQEVAQPQW
ncbi:MAG: YjbH domain-containing protein [Alphaproteobacteria bacterium]|nr:YjbH domain-containing protein [Alphaproteobacteria bacterium]